MSAALTVERHADAERFLDASQRWLLEREAENNLPLGIALSWRGRTTANTPFYWASVRDGSDVVGCACRTPPYPLVLSQLPTPAIDALIDDVCAVYPSLERVNGPRAVAEAFAGAWIGRRGGTWKTQIRLRLHELTQLSFAGPSPPGSLRKATQAELPLACEWMDEFATETGVPRMASDLTEQRIARGQLYFWIDGENPRAMVAWGRETQSGCAINTVHTPAQFRRRGYATAAVATLTQTLLEAGLRFCCLYTDLANPTSNSIYAKIGYRPIRDDAEIAFGP
jgi:predicted GNAT family acetyltransferase